MRKWIVPVLVLVVAIVALLVLMQDPEPQDTSDKPTDEVATSTTKPENEDFDRVRRKERDRTGAKAELDPALLDAQLREQDETLARIVGRAMLDPSRPATRAEIEVVRTGSVLARVPVGEGGTFEIKNLPPGEGALLSATAPAHAPGGVADLVLRAGQTVSVGTVYLGVAIDPSVDNEVRVRVTGPEAAAVEGARVTLTTQSASTFISLGPYDKQPGGVVLRAETDARGEVRFGPIPPGTYDAFADAAGLTFETVNRFVVQESTKETIDLELGVAQSIVGRVLGPDGEPLEGARVVALRFGDFTMFPAVESDADGTFEVKGLTGGNYMIFALADGIGGSDQQSVQPGGDPIDLLVRQGGDLKVRVTDKETGEPVTSFGLRPFRTGPFGYLYAPLLEFEASDGLVSVTLPETSYGLEVVAPGYRIHSEATIPLNPEAPVEIGLEKGGMIRGKVVSKATGNPVIGATIFIKRGGFPASPHKDLQTVTDSNGIFTLDKLGLDATNFRISHVDHTEESFTGVEPVAVENPDELPEPQEFRLGVGGRIEGRAFGDDSLPATGETVYLTLGGFDFSFNRSTKVDSTGRYSFDHVPTDRRYTVSLRSFMPGSGGLQQTDVQVEEGGTTTVDFGQEGGAKTLRGMVMRGGEPVAGMALSLTATDGRTSVLQGRSDETGAFVFEGVAAGAYQLSSQARGRTVLAIQVPEEGEPDPVEFVLGSSGITGRVVSAVTGDPLPNVWVELESLGEQEGAGLADMQRRWRGGRQSGNDGSFRFDGVDAGRYRIRGIGDGYAAAMLDDVTVAEGEVTADLVLELGTEGSFSGIVLDAVGNPIEGAALEVVDSSGRMVFMISLTQSSSDGTFTQGQLPPGTYTVTFKKDGYAPTTETVTVQAGAAAERTITLLRGGEIEVTALTPTGEPVKGAVVVLRDSDGKLVKRGVTLENLFSSGQISTNRFGRATLSGLAAGSYQVEVVVGGVASEPVTAEVVEAGSTAVEITTAPTE